MANACTNNGKTSGGRVRDPLSVLNKRGPRFLFCFISLAMIRHVPSVKKKEARTTCFMARVFAWSLSNPHLTSLPSCSSALLSPSLDEPTSVRVLKAAKTLRHEGFSVPVHRNQKELSWLDSCDAQVDIIITIDQSRSGNLHKNLDAATSARTLLAADIKHTQ